MQLDIAAWGWEDPHWDSLYPADLPDDWRLDYYANEFHALVLPAALYESQDETTLRGWFTEAHPRFHFYLEVNSPARARRVLQLLGDADVPAALGGWLWTGETDLMTLSGAVQVLAERLPGATWLSRPPARQRLLIGIPPALNVCWREGDHVCASTDGLIVVPIEAPPDLRTTQQMIRELQAAMRRQLLLAILPHSGAAQSLRQLHTLGLLLNG